MFRFIDWFADQAFEKIGTPAYVFICVLIFIGWIVLNTLVILKPVHFDEYPYILLNLVLSAQAMITAPLIMIAQNKAATRDREREEKQRESDDAHNRRMLTLLESIQTIVRAVEKELDDETS